jgi:hypothetical protein
VIPSPDITSPPDDTTVESLESANSPKDPPRRNPPRMRN